MPTTIGGFPAENVDPKEKGTKEWLIKYFRAALGTYRNLPARAIGARSADRYDLIRKYGLAQQSFQQYRDIMEPEVDHKELGYNRFVVSERIVPTMVKPRSIICSLIQKANEGYDIQLDPIDPQASMDLLEEGYQLQAKVLLRKTLSSAKLDGLANSAPIAKEPGEPDDLDGARVAVMGMRHKAALKGELVISNVLNYNNWERLREDIAADLVDFGVAYTRDETSGSMVTIRKGDMRRLIVSEFNQPDASDIKHAGELQRLPINQVIADSNGYVREDELKEIYELASSGDRQEIFGVIGDWDRTLRYGTVQVLDMELISTDTDYREERKTKYGNIAFIKGKYGKNANQGATIHKRACQNVYCGKWIVGTDIMYKYGLRPMQKLDYKNECRVRLSFNFAIGHIHNMDAYSITENMIVFSDSIQMRRIKMEHLFNTAIPKGFQINLSALEEIAIDAAGEQFLSPKDIMGLIFTRGLVLYRGESLIEDGKVLDAPVKETMTTIGEELVQYWNDIERNVQMMMDTVGLNENTDGSSPDAKRTNPATAAAINGTKNALAKLFSAERWMSMATAQSVLIRAQMLMKVGKGEEFVAALGSATVSYLKGAPAFDAHRFGFKIVDRPTQEQNDHFEELLQAAVQKGELGSDDVAMLRAIQNLKERTEFLVYKVRKNKEDVRAHELEVQRTQGDVQVRSVQASEEAKQASYKVEYSLKAELVKLEKDLELRNKREEILGTLEKERIAATGRTDAAYVQAQERQDSNVRNNQTTLLKEGKDSKVDKLNLPQDLKTDIAPQGTDKEPIPDVNALPQQQFSFLGKPLADNTQAPSAAPPPPEQGQQQQDSGMPADDENAEPAPDDESAEGGQDQVTPDESQMMQGGMNIDQVRQLLENNQTAE